MSTSLRLVVRICLALLTVGFVTAAASRANKPQTRRPATVASGTFKPSCTTPNFPQPRPSSTPAIDAQCGLAGSGSGAEGNQNAAKNNFCASGSPTTITINDLQSLQAQVERKKTINFGDENSADRKRGPTTNRAPLQKIGEGKQVVLKAFVLIARQEGAESVNCARNVANTPSFHDIHISLVAASTETSECAGVVAEMSPHRRPDAWTQENVMKVAAAKAMVRVTGQLFFDSSHVPCANGQGVRSNPRRTSLWEIHPIYKFEVCTADCDGAGQWLPLDQWINQR